MSEAVWALFEGTHHVKAPDREWLGDGDGLELLFWQMGLLSIELASFAPADNLLYISQRSGLVKTLAKSSRPATLGLRDVRRFRQGPRGAASLGR